MIKRFCILLAASLLTIAAAAEVKTFNLQLDDFSTLVVTDGINVVYKTMPDSAGYVAFTCDQHMADQLLFTSGRGKLRIQVGIPVDDEPLTCLPTVHVYSSSIAKIENSGDSLVEAHLDGPVAKLKLRIVGNGRLVADGIYANNVDAGITTGHGHMVLIGRSASLKLTNVGTGPVEAGSLEAKDVKCWAVGTGPIDCWATERLSIFGAGSGNVYYKGKPAKIVNRSIGVKAISVESR